MVGRHLTEPINPLADLLASPASRRATRDSRERALALLGRVGLSGRADDVAANLPYGALKRLEIARALAAEPKVLLLDEPAAGCNAVETEEIDTLIKAVAAGGITVVLVEHDMKLVMRISDRIHVLDHGETLAEGTAEEVRANPDVVAAYLGPGALEERRDA
jgi:branched-chain amino acid transport system ATP-binding protein